MNTKAADTIMNGVGCFSYRFIIMAEAEKHTFRPDSSQPSEGRRVSADDPF